MNGRRLAALLIAVVALVAAGCGGSDNNEASSDTVTAVATETTSMDTTSTSDTSGTSTDSSVGNLSGECAQFAGVSTKIAESLSGQNANIEDAAKAFDEIASQVPDEIKDDYQVIAENFSKIAEALKGVDLTSGKAPSAEALAKLQEVSTSMDSAEVQQATKNIEAWVQQNC